MSKKELSYEFFRGYIEMFKEAFTTVKNKDSVFRFIQTQLYQKLDSAQKTGKITDEEHTNLMLLFNEIAIEK